MLFQLRTAAAERGRTHLADPRRLGLRHHRRPPSRGDIEGVEGGVDQGVVEGHTIRVTPCRRGVGEPRSDAPPIVSQFYLT